MKIQKQNNPHSKVNRGFGAVLFFLIISFGLSSVLVIAIIVGIPATLQFTKAVYGVFTQKDDSVNLRQAPSELTFKDIPADSKYLAAADYLKRQGIVEGFDDGTLRPELTLKRGELMKLILLTQGKYPTALSYGNCFKDVRDEWYAPYVCYAKKQGWVGGVDDGKFYPESPITKAETLKILVEAFNLREKHGDNLMLFADVPADSWYRGYVKIALDNELLEENPVQDFFQPDQKISRGDVFQMLYKILVS